MTFLVILALVVWGGVCSTQGAEDSKPRDPAATIVSNAGVKAGLCVHLGCADGSLAMALAESAPFLVHGLSLDPGMVEQVRKSVQARGLYGRVSIDRVNLPRLPYAGNL
ncbi:MAG: class I SAM-dependent methyltransferase, partial [Planctomycetota bacterium]